MAGKQDDEASRDPREVAGLCKAIPKHNLGKLLHRRRGMVAEFADAMGVNSKYPSKWVSGDKRMTNEQVAKASWLLGVHPLYLLDMREEEDPAICYIPYEDEGLLVPRESMIEAVGFLSIPAIGKYDERSQRWETLYGFTGGPTECESMCVNPDIGFERSTEYVPMSTEEAESLRKEAIRSLVAIDGDFRNPSGVMFAMLEILLSTAGGSNCVFVFDDLEKLFVESAYSNDDAMCTARARLASD
ncbi:MAG: hypothetical protein LKG13_01145 [Atopobiaceae bacterium]|nr:hypothetical protein [Atopobiaceae bacterium]MCH4214981.1 hypothetical protein [Atopobiaceae bacterium]MCH4277156.1 hypothetical protein [Atopobiaceae bacterium]MCI1227363.1 hypothetical protein [Atopobiaceae bacterium]MCI1259269.1 hypothetical protein [Atopobiaceae bacterium]